jgi:hypothetical protein
MSLEECVQRPLDIVQRAMAMQDEASLRESGGWGIPDMFNKHFQTDGAIKAVSPAACIGVCVSLARVLTAVRVIFFHAFVCVRGQVPSLNDYFPDGKPMVLPGPTPDTLVRFRAMVQDTLNTE